MNHYMDFDPALIRARNERIREEVNSLRLQERPPKKRNPRISGNTGTSRVLLTVLALSVVAGVLMLALGAQEARAAFPGTNGRIAFASERTTGEGVDNPTGDYEIFTMNRDGTGLKQLTFNTVSDISPSFSADGDWIVFSSYRDGNYEIYLMDSNGAGTQFRITNNSVSDENPTTRDGNQIAFESERGGNYDIYVKDAGGERNLTNNPAFDYSPSFSPDGSKIAFTSNRDGNPEVYVMDSDGTDQTNLSNNPGIDFEPAWSPNGQKIAFTGAFRQVFNAEIYKMNADGSSQKQLTRNAAFEHSPAWSPDGKKLAFTSERGDGDDEIYTMKPRLEDSTNRPNNLTRNSVSDVGPDWQPLVN